MTADPIVLREVDPEGGQHGVRGHAKPDGFWYEVNSGWRRWCKGEDWNTENLCHLHTVHLRDCNVLRITSVAEYRAFTEEYVREDTSYPPALRRYAGKPDWARLGAEYDGLEIAPYRWEFRLDDMWYYGWDCASGVIWRPRHAEVLYVRALLPVARRAEDAGVRVSA